VSLTRATELLHLLTGDPEAGFRDGQWEAIDRLVSQRGRVLVVQRTGWGKSAVYFIATRLLREAGAGPTILISPLLALMRNQIEAAERAGVVAITINSANQEDWAELEERIAAGTVDLLLISPERLNNDRFRRDVLPHLLEHVGLLVIDEAHCISDWGHDFRPDYRRIAAMLDEMPPTVPVLCTTATANDRVIADIHTQLGDELDVQRGPLDRLSLRLAVHDMPAPAQRLAWLVDTLPQLPGSGIVYCLTIRDTRAVADWLSQHGIDAAAYSGDDDPHLRIELEQRLLANDLKVLVATSALGMGFDKPDLGFVVHYQSPGSPIAYYQQVGRAGRALAEAHGVLLCGTEDREIQDYFIKTALPEQWISEQVVGILAEATGPVSVPQLEGLVNLGRMRLTLLLKVLEVDGVVARAGSGWVRTSLPWTYDTARIEAVNAHRRAEQAAMVAYARSGRCRMRQLRELLDDPEAADCGRCDVCTGAPTVAPAAGQPAARERAALEEEALVHLRSGVVELEPRKRWAGAAGSGLPSGNIPAGDRVEVGRGLGVLGDGGWGPAIATALTGDGLDPELLGAFLGVVEAWAPEPGPEWVTFVPSRSGTVPADVAAYLGRQLGLPVHDVVERVAWDRPAQSGLANSVQQLQNVHGAFTVRPDVPAGPVLVVDDITDSRWTLTTVGAALRRAGASSVLPLVLAAAAG
jgi:ATP-dependent DNA helicase RecQ